ncbi:MAG: PAS domain S-box protein [Chlorobiaceae bacterium]|nr:PAS domain S-box protein [Chlorobiaceae bacterium]
MSAARNQVGQSTPSLEASLHAILSAISEPAFLIRSDGTLIDANQSLRNTFALCDSPDIAANVSISDGKAQIPVVLTVIRQQAIEALRCARELSFVDEKFGELLHYSIIPFPAPAGNDPILLVIIRTEPAQPFVKDNAVNHRQQALLDAIPGSAFIIDEHARLAGWNSFARDIIIGKSDEAMSDVDPFLPIHPDERELAKEKFTRIFQTGVDATIEMRTLHHARKGYQWRLVSGKRINIDGRPCVLMVGTDINKQKQSEQALTESRRRLDLALESARAGVWEWNLGTGENFWSDEFWALCKLSKEEKQASFDLWASTIHPDDREQVKATVKKATEKNREINIEYRMLLPDGQIICLYSRGKPVFNDNGTVDRYIGTIIDITERKQAEENLKINQARQDFILEKSHIGWWNLDLKTFATIRTAEYDRIIGHGASMHDWTYQTLLDHIVPEDRVEVTDRFQKSLSTLANSEYEFRIRRPDGEIRWIWLTAGFQLDPSGKPIHLSGIVRDITGNKEILESLQQSETRYRSLFDNMPKGLVYCKVLYDGDTPVDFIHLAVNPAYEKLTGFDDVIGKGILEIMPGIREIDEEFFQVHCRVARTGIAEHFESYLKPIDQWVSTSVYSPEKDHFVAIIDVVTEQKKSAKAIAESKAKLETVLESMTDVVLISDADGNFIDFNEAFASYHKFSSKAECSKSLSSYTDLFDVFTPDGELVPPDNWVVFRALRGETNTNAEFILHRKDTDETWFGNYSFAPVYNNEGNIAGSVITARDVTEKKRAEFTIKESELKFRSIFDSAPLAISIETARDHRLVDVNASWERLFGLRKEEVLGRSMKNIGIQAGDDDHVPFRKQLEKEGRIINSARELRTKSGETVHALCSAVYLTVEGTLCMMVMTTDISDQKRAAEEHEKLQAQLQQAQKMEMVGQLAGGIAHDFNNVLAAILGNTEMLLEQLDISHPFSQNLESIRNASLRSAQLIHQLLAFARKQLTTPVLLEIDDSIEHLQPMLKMMAGKNIRLLWKPGTRNAKIRIDPSQLDQIITNLLVNARDAISGTGTVIIETLPLIVEQRDCEAGHPCKTPGHYVILSIRDTGSGIDSQVLPHIFEPYFTTKEVGKGSGLGLSTVYGIVKQNGGHIECTTLLTEGTTFTVFLPKVLTETETDEPAIPESDPGEASPQILLVEDEPEILKLIRMILGKYGYSVIEASNADEALELADAHLDHIELLVTDVVLPKMNGFLLSRKLQEKNPGLKVLFMSGYAPEAIGFNEIMDSGINFIQKPFTFRKFTKAIEQALR